MEWFPCLVAPDFLGLIPTVDVDRPRVPVIFLAPDVVAPFQQQDPFARRRERVCEGSATRATADDDDIVVGCCSHELPPVRRNQFRPLSARSRLNAALISARCVNACGKFPNASPLGPVSSANRPR